MIKVLIVDDNDARVAETYEILYDLKIKNDNIQLVKSIIEAKRIMSKERFDVLLLDLVLPVRDGEAPSDRGGIDLLKEINDLELYKLPHTVLVISEYDEAILNVQDFSREMSYSTIKYLNNSEEWKTRLKNYIDQELRSGAQQRQDYNYDVAIICALSSPELEEIKKLPFNWQTYNEYGDSTDYFSGEINGKRIICAASYEMGLSAAAILSTKMINLFRPRYLLMSGIAGGVNNGEINLGDVLVADPCFDYESGKRTRGKESSEFKPDYRQIRLNDSALQIARRIASNADVLKDIWTNCSYNKPENPFKIIIGPFGSGAAVVSDPSIIAEVREHNRKFIGFDMEAYAVMLAGSLSTFPKTVPVVMKSVSDFGEGKTDNYQQYAAYTSARVLEQFIYEVFKQ